MRVCLFFLFITTNHRNARTVTGVLKGYDQLLNLVLDEVEEQVQGTVAFAAALSLSPTFAFLTSGIWLQIQSHARGH